jgi:hypothetical protein
MPALTPLSVASHSEAFAATATGLYATSYYSTRILGFRAANRVDKGPICSVGPTRDTNGVAVDEKGDLIDPDGGAHSIVVYQGPDMCGKKIGAVDDPYGIPNDAASADAATGTIVVANRMGTIALCTLKSGCTVDLKNPIMKQAAAVALAPNGDCWASGRNAVNHAVLVYFRRCTGSGLVAQGYLNQGWGGLDIDDFGNLVAISQLRRSKLYVYKGCNPKCSLVGGPFTLRGVVMFGHLNRSSTKLAVGNSAKAEVEIYRYSPGGVKYAYGFHNGFSVSADVDGVAFDPRSGE